MRKITEITPKTLAYELDAVIIDVEDGAGFDDVCLKTIKYVKSKLFELDLRTDEDKKVKAGEAIMVPLNEEHAKAMLTVAMAYLEQFKEK